MSLLTPDSGLLFWMIVSFGIVFVILSKYGFPVIIKAVEQRKAYIDNSLETARPTYPRREGESNPRGPFRDCRPFDRHSREGDERKDQPRQGTTTNHRPAVG